MFLIPTIRELLAESISCLLEHWLDRSCWCKSLLSSLTLLVNVVVDVY